MTTTLEVTKMRAIIYDRVSVRDDQSQTEHLARCRDFCSARGWDVVREETETVSGFSRKAARPAWDRVEAAVKAGDVDAVVVFAVSRAGRNVARFAAFVELCRDAGVVFASATEPIDTSGPMGTVILSLLGALAEVESATKRERTLVGREVAKRNGTWTGGKLRFGLALADGNRLVADPTEAPLIRDAATAILNGTSLRTVARDWNAAGVTTRGGNAWAAEAVRDVLAAESNVPLILTAADQRRLMDLFDSRRTGRAPERFLLAGLLRCAQDGHALTGRTGGRSKGDGRTQPPKYVCQHGPEGRRLHMTVDAVALEEYVQSAVWAREAETPFEPVQARDPADDLVAERDRLVVALEDLGESDLSEHVIRGRERKLARELEAVESQLADAARPADAPTWDQWYAPRSPEVKIRQHVRRITVAPAGKAARRFDPARVVIDWAR